MDFVFDRTVEGCITKSLIVAYESVAIVPVRVSDYQ
jgi:hypothetical protein